MHLSKGPISLSEDVLMADIVVCDDIDGAFQNSGELARAGGMGTVVVYDRVAETREELLHRLQGTSIALAIRDRTVLDRETLAALPELRFIASSRPHLIDFNVSTNLIIFFFTTP